jgi:hypothetical protein
MGPVESPGHGPPCPLPLTRGLEPGPHPVVGLAFAHSRHFVETSAATLPMSFSRGACVRISGSRRPEGWPRTQNVEMGALRGGLKRKNPRRAATGVTELQRSDFPSADESGGTQDVFYRLTFNEIRRTT